MGVKKVDLRWPLKVKVQGPNPEMFEVEYLKNGAR